MKNRIKEWREHAGLSQAELAELADTTSQQIGRLEKGTRKLTQEWLNTLSSALHISPMDLLPQEMSKPLELTTIPKVGFVEAGYWQEACQLPEVEWENILFPINGNLRGKRIFALGVKGESMNKIFPPDRTILICCDIEDWEQDPENGDYVIAYREQGGMCEATVKRFYKVSDNQYILRPESTNGEFFDIIVTADQNCEYRIGAIVLDYQTKLKQI